MKMKQHILAALGEERDAWQVLVAGLSDEQCSAPLLPSEWTVKDVLAHLRAWQMRSIARLEAALLDREPEFPRWLAGIDPDGEGSPDQVNAWIYATYRDQPWSQVYADWSGGFQRFVELAGQIPERDLLDTGKYPWLAGYSLALILLASYDHHQEHYEKLLTWLQEHNGDV